MREGPVAYALGSDSGRALLSVRDVSLAFPVKGGGVHPVFSSLHLDIHPGEFVAIVGQTGCGKSTLLRMLLGSQRADSGEILLAGERVIEPCRDRGYVPQKYSLFPDKTVLQNIEFGPCMETGLTWWRKKGSIRQDALRYLQQVGLSRQDASKYPDQLSGGMQQRVAIAQALIMHPKILLMDEAFSALDPQTRTSMQKMLRKLWRDTGITVVFITHNLPEAVYLSSRIVLLGRDPELGCSTVRQDTAVSNYIRGEDDYPRRDALDTIIQDLENAALPNQFAQEMAEFGG